jgi:8-oxo-dGTP pyrophosphatase MutT (NUDIX family)
MIYSFLWKIKNAIQSTFSYKTIGARALVIKDGKVLLITHTYMPKWHTIGGGVDKGESPIEAVERELFEEVGISCLKKPKLFNIYLNTFEKRDDYVALYIVEEFSQTPVVSPEIKASEWFDLTDAI